MRNKRKSACFPLQPLTLSLPLLSVFLELDNPEARVAEIHSIVHRLPEKNRQMLELLMKHLAKWVLGLTPLFIRRYKSNRAKDLRGLPLYKNLKHADGNKGLNFPFVFVQLKRAACFPPPVLSSVSFPPVPGSVFFCASLIWHPDCRAPQSRFSLMLADFCRKLLSDNPF